MKKIILAVSLFLFISFSANATLLTPNLNSPPDGAVNCRPDETVDWGTVSGATEYEYRFGTDSLLTGVLSQFTTSHILSNYNLFFGTTYYWQVRALKTTVPVDSSAWTSIFRFTVTDSIFLASPANGATSVQLGLNLSWVNLPGVAYDVELDTSLSFTSNLGLIGNVDSTIGVATTNILGFGSTYYWRVRARTSVDTTQWSQTWSFTTVGSIVLIYPPDGSTNQFVSQQLIWDNPGPFFYQYQVDTSITLNSPALIQGITTVNHKTVNNLFYGTHYYWRVRSMVAPDTSDWSLIWDFTTIDEVILQSPANGAINLNPSFLMQWSSSGSIYNIVQWDTSASFNSPILYTASPTGSNFNTFDLRFGATYYWRVCETNTVDTSGWSQTWSFSTMSQIIGLIFPVDGSIDEDPGVGLSWYDLTGATFYDFQLDTTLSFNSPLLFDSSATTGFNAAHARLLHFGTNYYWRVRARHTADTSDWTPPWSFTTLTQPVLLTPSDGAINQPENTILLWNDIDGIDWYEINVDTTPLFNSPELFHYAWIYYSFAGHYTWGLLLGTTYYWEVRARHSADTSDWSQVWSFTTSNSGVGINEMVNSGSFIKNVSQDQSNLFIQLEKNLSHPGAGFKIIDISGRTVLSFDIKDNNTVKINKELLRKGIYFIQLASGQAIETRKLFIY